MGFAYDERCSSALYGSLQKMFHATLACRTKRSHRRSMANIIAFLFGLIALILAIIGFIPLLGWLNWLIILIAGVGAVFGFVSEKNAGRNFCFVVMAICALRLWIGGGII
jgi:hypothetical protein